MSNSSSYMCVTIIFYSLSSEGHIYQKYNTEKSMSTETEIKEMVLQLGNCLVEILQDIDALSTKLTKLNEQEKRNGEASSSKQSQSTGQTDNITVTAAEVVNDLMLIESKFIGFKYNQAVQAFIFSGEISKREL